MQVALAIHDPSVRTQVRQSLSASGWTVDTWPEPTRPPADWKAAAILVVDEAADVLEPAVFDALIQQRPAIYVQVRNDARLTLGALRRGYQDCLLTDEMPMLSVAIDRLAQGFKGEAAPSLPGHLFLCISANGGSGKTSLCAHLGLSLAHIGIRTLAVDFSLGHGMLRHAFGVTGTATWGDLLPVIHELNDHHLRNAVERVRPNLDLLAAPAPTIAQGATAQELTRLLDACAARYDLLVVDTPSLLTPAPRSLASHASTTLCLIEPTSMGLWAAGALLAQFDPADLPRDRLRLITNARSPQVVAISAGEIRKLYGLPVLAELSYDSAAPLRPARAAWDERSVAAGLAREVEQLARTLLKGLQGATTRSEIIRVPSASRGR
jgi:Flp pilus assembly CpaE family ATPase